MAVTFLVLLTGIAGMVIGGDFNKKYSNKLMRARVVSQAFAVCLFAVAMMV